MREQSKEVIEKVLECIRDIADMIGPAGVISNIGMIMTSLENLLNKEAHCQLKGGQAMDDEDYD